MKKLLLWGDAPCVTTGFGKVNEEILKRFHGYEITVIGVNYYGEVYDLGRFPYHIFVARTERDMLGRTTFVNALKSQQWDLVITHNDVGVIKGISELVEVEHQKQKFQWIAYMPIDHDTLEMRHIDFMVLPDEVLVYSQFGKDVITKIDRTIGEKIKVAWLGTDTDNYKPLKNRYELRKKHFGIEDNGTILVLNVNANRWRKDHPHGVLGFSFFNKKFPNSKYYIHAPTVEQGGNLRLIAANCHVPENAMIFNDEMSPLHGASNKIMNEIYNCADIVMSSTMSEGWGLSCTEAFATKVPALFPRHTSLIEMIGEKEERGTFCDLSDEMLMAWQWCSYWRPIVSSKSIAEKLEWIIKNEKQVKERAENAYNWVQDMTWDNVVNKVWLPLL